MLKKTARSKKSVFMQKPESPNRRAARWVGVA
jgi:hypothetical protein